MPTHLTPQGILKAYYISKHSGHPSVPDLLNDLAFEFEEQKWGQRTWHTARFVCPLTKQVYEAGKLSSRDIYEQWNWSKGDRKNPIRMNDKLYYARKQTAAHAAAARWVDSINSLQSGQLSPEESYCVDDLALLSTIHDVDNMSDDDRIGVGAQVGGLSVDHPDPMERRKRNEAHQHLLKLIASSCSPTTVLLEYYQLMNFEFDIDMIESTPISALNNETSRIWWKASFVCPLSGKLYRSGSLKDETKSGKCFYFDDEPYYHRRKWARHAAAAVALDDIFFQITGDATQDRLCHDDPSRPDDVYKHPDADNCYLIITNSLEPMVENEPEVHPVEEEYVLVPIEGGRNTLERVLEGWSKQTTTVNNSLHSPSALLPLTWNPLQQRAKIVHEAEAWFPREDEKPQKWKGYVTFKNPTWQMASLTFCNSLLFALSKANQIQNGPDVQVIADEIFDFVKSKHEPDADTVCAYILCLSGSPQSVAQKAHDILQDMITSKSIHGKEVPALTADVFHTVIDLWACAGDAAKCQEVVASMVSSQMVIDSSIARVVVSSLAHGTFNLGAMKSIIEKFSEVGVLDKETYYAPLRWSGKHFKTGTVPWDNFAEIYRQGFSKAASKQSTEEAHDLASWVSNLINDENLTVVIGCYETVIQAWVRTGTRFGLQQAELWAKRVLNDASKNDNLQPTLKTFHPILAALAHSGEDLSRLKNQIERIKRDGTIEVDGRIHALPLLAWKRREESLHLPHVKYDVSKGKLAVTESLNEVTRLCEMVESYHSSQSDIPIFLESSAFCDALTCVGSFGKQRASNGDRTETDVAIDSIFRIVGQYQATIRKLQALASEVQNGIIDDDDDDDEEKEVVDRVETTKAIFKLQLCHLLNGAPGLFRCALHCLSDIDKALTSQSEKHERMRRSSIIQLLPEIETMLRVAVKCDLLLQSLESSDVGLTVQYADGFSYQGDSTKYLASRTDLCFTVAELLATTDNNKDLYCGDKARIIRLVVDMVINDTNLSTGQMTNGCVRIMHALKLIKESKEKEGLLRHVTKLVMPYMKDQNGKIDLHAVLGLPTTENVPRGYLSSSDQKGPRDDSKVRKGDEREARRNGHAKSKHSFAKKRVTATSR